MTSPSVTDDPEAEREARAFRKRTAPIAFAVAANVALAAVCLGVPYWRGRMQAQDALRAYGRFASCLFDGAPKNASGLGLPLGERAHYAGLVMNAGPGWPERCKPALHAMAPAEAIFLWPSVKLAGSDVRATIRLVDTELSQLARTRQLGGKGRVPERPLLAFAKLQAAAALLAKATSTDGEVDTDAIAFPKPASAVDPARLPIVAGSSASLQVWPGTDGLYALAMDSRGVSWLRLAGGKLDHRRFKRTSLVRAALRTDGDPFIVWAMSQQRCADDEHHCLRRAMGLARLPAEAETLPTPSWFGGHPSGRVDRSLRVGLEDRVELLARADADGNVEVRRYKFAPSEQPDAPPSAPLQRFAVDTATPPEDALLLPGQPPAVAYALRGEPGLEVSLLRYDPGEPPASLGHVNGDGAWLVACDATTARYVAFGSASELAITRVANDGTVANLLPSTAIALGEPLHPDDPAHDRLRLFCSDAGAALVVNDAERSLSSVRCDAQSCARGEVFAHGVASFDALPRDDGLFVAYSGTKEPQLSVVTLDPQGKPRAEAMTPAPCWDPASGMCGVPTLVRDGARVILCARDGSDLLALESNDGGAHWQALSGLKVEGAINTDVNAPMMQHRKRKGLD